MAPTTRSRSKRKARSAQSASAVNLPLPLPSCDGPKLGPFEHSKTSIKFISLLSAESTARHGHVFEVAIKSRRYALKVFKFYDYTEHWFDTQDADIPKELIIEHMDPFYAECRAYGCIQKNKRKRKVAVAADCYGYVKISAGIEKELATQFAIHDWDRPLEEYNQPASKRQSLRAIVKELIPQRTPFVEKMISQMRKDLFALRRMGVYTRDIRQENYRNGKLLDFSVAWTVPHLMLSEKLRPAEYIERDRAWELSLFDAMVEEANMSSSVKAAPNKAYVNRLRPRAKREERSP